MKKDAIWRAKRRALLFETIRDSFIELWTYKEVAESLKVSAPYLSDIKNGKKWISDEMVGKLLAKLKL